MSRYQLFVGHYKLLREKRKKESIFRTLLSAYPLGDITLVIQYGTVSYGAGVIVKHIN